MRSDSFGKVTIATNSNRKKAKFNWSHDNNTSYDWGSVQPILSKFMMPDSSINVNMEQLTRLAPMVVPTFGRVKMKNVVHFVSLRDIFPNLDYFLSHTPINRPVGSGDYQFIPNVLPHVNSSLLSAFCLAGARCNVYVSGVLGTDREDEWTCYGNGSTTDQTELSKLVSWFFGSINGSAFINRVYDLAQWNYKGFCWSIWKLTSGSSSRGFAMPDTGDDFFAVPTITTLDVSPLDATTGNIANGFTHSILRKPNPYNSVPTPFVHMNGADVIWESYIDSVARGAGSGSAWEGCSATSRFDGRRLRFCFRLSSFGKRLRKILIGLGYNFSLSDSSEVSILPLLAFYKACWDSYAPQRERNFYSTPAWQLIQMFIDGNLQCNMTTFMSDQNLGGNMRNYFKRFIMELGTLFATERMDAIAASTDKVLLDSNDSWVVARDSLREVMKVWQDNFIANYGNTITPSLTAAGAANLADALAVLEQHDFSSTTGISDFMLSQPQLDALKKAYLYQNKRSVAGKLIADILRMQGQGKYVEECQGRFVAASEDGIKISDVVATAATEDASLGQYGGRGLGVSADQFSYKTDTYGYLIMLSCVVPESGYINAPDLQNEVITYGQFYNPEYDGFNYEAVLKKQVVGSPLISVDDDNSANSTLGFLPTYSKFKFTSNKANGDFSLCSMRTQYRPYTLDKYIPVDEVSISEEANDSTTGDNAVRVSPRFGYDKLPNSGEDYRYINKQPWNGDFNRIFKAEGDEIEWQYSSVNDNGYLFNSFEYDNFLTHNVFRITYNAPMKAIEDSYSTYDEDGIEEKGGITRS